MAAKTNKYFKTDGKYIYLEYNSAEIYIPDYYFTTAGDFAEDKGETIRCLGILNIGFFENGTLKEMRMLKIPTWLELYVLNIESREVNLPGEGPILCKVLTYAKGHKIMNSYIIEDSSNVEKYFSIILKGKLPKAPYSSLCDLFLKNQALNGVTLPVPAVIEELILSGACRYKDNPNIRFSQAINEYPNISDYDYSLSNVRQICQYTSTFTALTFEDMDSMISSSLNRTRNKEEEIFSPVEDLLKL